MVILRGLAVSFFAIVMVKTPSFPLALMFPLSALSGMRKKSWNDP